jgi:hypothetical protein
MFALSRSFTIGASIGIAAAFAIAIASHGILDAMTNEGLGVMLLYPFSDERISFPWRPFHSPPIKLSNLSWHQVQMMLKSEFPIVSRLRHHRRDGQIRFGSHWRQGKAEGYLIRGIRSTQKPLYCEIMHYLCPMPNFRDIALYRRNQSL